MHFNSRPRKEVDAGDAASDATDKLFQLTTSQGGRQSLTIPDAFADAFQLTTSQGGRRMRQQVSLNYIAISTHDLARRSTAFGRLYNLALVFQLTTSQGGRQERRYLLQVQLAISTHDLARRSTAF